MRQPNKGSQLQEVAAQAGKQALVIKAILLAFVFLLAKGSFIKAQHFQGALPRFDDGADAARRR